MQGSSGDTDTEKRLMSTVGRGREKGAGSICGDSNVDTYITTCKTDGQRTFAVCLRECRRGSVAT